MIFPCSTTLLIYRLTSFTNFNAQFLYSLTICMLYYDILEFSLRLRCLMKTDIYNMMFYLVLF